MASSENYCHCKNDCHCEPICCIVPSFKVHNPLSPGPGGHGGELSVIYYAHHFNVDVNNHEYDLHLGIHSGQKMILRIASSGGGQVSVNVEHLAGPFGQIQLLNVDDWAELHYRNCQWHLADHKNATCV